MRLIPFLRRTHIGWHFDKHWKVQGKRKPIRTTALMNLQQRGIPVVTPEDVLQEKKEIQRYDIVGIQEKPILFDNTHPDWHDRVLLSYKDNNVLVEGLKQAQVLTKTVELVDGLPEKLLPKNVPKKLHAAVQTITLSSHLFDAEQKKLPKRKDPKRPAWNFRRDLGVTQDRRTLLMTSKLLQLIESSSDRKLAQERYLFSDLLFSFPFEHNKCLMQFQLTGDFVLTSAKPLEPATSESTESFELPDISPFLPGVSMNEENIYKIQKVYPIKSSVVKSHPHTLFVHYNEEVVKNLYEENVTEDQIFGRSLLKAFTVAASYARERYGEDVKSLPEPVTVQCVHTDGRFFHFGVFQLNTLDVSGDSATKNVWYQTPIKYLFDTCCYELGKPILRDYNGDVIKHLCAFYDSV